jgi:CRP-like cAMP-binding protein
MPGGSLLDCRSIAAKLPIARHLIGRQHLSHHQMIAQMRRPQLRLDAADFSCRRRQRGYVDTARAEELIQGPFRRDKPEADTDRLSLHGVDQFLGVAALRSAECERVGQLQYMHRPRIAVQFRRQRKAHATAGLEIVDLLRRQGLDGAAFHARIRRVAGRVMCSARMLSGLLPTVLRRGLGKHSNRPNPGNSRPDRCRPRHSSHRRLPANYVVAIICQRASGSGMIPIMSEAIIDLLARMAPRNRLCTRETILFRTGDPVRSLFVVAQGAARLARITPAGQALTLQQAAAPAILAEASVFAERYHCEGVAEPGAHIASLSMTAIRRRLAQDAGFAENWARHLAAEVQKARATVEILALRRIGERVEAWLALNGGATPPKGEWHRWAAAIGVTPAALYRELARRRGRDKWPVIAD